jgi:hypothetical protein
MPGWLDNNPICTSHCSWDYRLATAHPASSVYSASQAWNEESPDLGLLCSWDDRLEPLAPGLYFLLLLLEIKLSFVISYAIIL